MAYTKTQRSDRSVDFLFRSKIYAHLLGHLTLTKEHEHDLVARGMTAEEVVQGGFKSLTGPFDTQNTAAQIVKDIGEDRLVDVPGFVQKGQDYWTLNVTQGLVIPITDMQGNVRALQVRTGGKSAKYVTVTGGPGGNVGTQLHVPAKSVRGLLDGYDLLVTEGPIKAQIAAGRGYPASVGLMGVDASPSQLLRLVESYQPAHTLLAFDMDRLEKEGVLSSMYRLADKLLAAGQVVQIAEWDPKFNGIDDYLVYSKDRSVTIRQYRIRGEVLGR